ncbi:hypothetical protein MN608_10757 [Microdochium nivale]|nr:hypothetical protein MN608_10757 [Microdochium nivale]
MSATTTAVETRTANTVLDDYTLRHTGGSRTADVISINSSSPSEAASTTGDGLEAPVPWDTTHRRVPPYRPTNRDRDVSQIRVYQNGIEQVFVGTMFTGVFLNATKAQIERIVFGDKFRNVPVGGEI